MARLVVTREPQSPPWGHLGPVKGGQADLGQELAVSQPSHQAVQHPSCLLGENWLQVGNRIWLFRSLGLLSKTCKKPKAYVLTNPRSQMRLLLAGANFSIKIWYHCSGLIHFQTIGKLFYRNKVLWIRQKPNSLADFFCQTSPCQSFHFF